MGSAPVLIRSALRWEERDDVDEMSRGDHIIWLAKLDRSAVGGKPEGRQ